MNNEKIIYFPLEPYKERYTVQLSKPKTGWLESRWLQNGIPYIRIEGEGINSGSIKTGQVLDASGRGYWACSQICEFLGMLEAGYINSGDVIYFDDFWHPGIEALAYTLAQKHGMYIEMYAMLHAQSVDVYDFTYPMRSWMRHFEIGIGKILSGIFVTSTCLRDLCLEAGIGSPHTVHICGLPYNSDEVRTHFPEVLPERKKQVIYSSRWDSEKRPEVFLAIAKEVLHTRQDITFLVTTSAEKVRSNDNSLVLLLAEVQRQWPNNIIVKVGQSKEQYYANLLESKIQINTADQDFVSWTLLEATTCGCRPLYPYWRSFPECLNYHDELMYEKGDVKQAAEKIIKYIDQDYDMYKWAWVYKPFDKSWQRMYQAMRRNAYEPLYSCYA